jgi:hypothetical protein
MLKTFLKGLFDLLKNIIFECDYFTFIHIVSKIKQQLSIF